MTDCMAIARLRERPIDDYLTNDQPNDPSGLAGDADGVCRIRFKQGPLVDVTGTVISWRAPEQGRILVAIDGIEGLFVRTDDSVVEIIE